MEGTKKMETVLSGLQVTFVHLSRQRTDLPALVSVLTCLRAENKRAFSQDSGLPGRSQLYALIPLV